MNNALKKGVLVVKAAGNSGTEGPFTADVYTAVGSIAAASVGDDITARPLDERMVTSQFSSYGPVRPLVCECVHAEDYAGDLSRLPSS
jgi:hypothetical protein